MKKRIKTVYEFVRTLSGNEEKLKELRELKKNVDEEKKKKS